MKRLGIFAALAVTCLPAPAYYHYVHYLNGTNVLEKFDLTALTNNTVTFFVSEAGPVVYNQTDTFNSVVAQIAQATQIWNGVSASNIRVAFGGLENGSTLQNTPGSDVVFEDLPPGLYGYGGPTSKLAPVTAADGTQFVPIARSAVHLNQNLTILPPNSTGPSYTSIFFLTCVHEMGHALGLQHTFTSSVMSQATSRATTLSHPIDADDIAGLSILYPTPAFSQFGTITGRITNGSAGVHLASVVAIHQGGWGAVSALTNPDGTFQIQGVPTGQYYVYAHTLPPDADILGPWNADGSVAPPSGDTNALFFSGVPGGTPGGVVTGTTDPTQATQITVASGGTASGINIALSSRSSVEIYDVQILGYYNYNGATEIVEPAYIDLPLLFPGGVVSVNAVGYGLTSPGLKIQTMPGSSISIYGMQPSLATAGFTAESLFMQIGASPVFEPQHVVVNSSDYMYVLPDGLSISPNVPPTVTSIKNTGNTTTVTGTNWASDSLIYFDGLPAAISSLDPVNGIATVVPPVGSPSQTSVITVYNSDGQNSEFLQSASPITYNYGNLAQASITAINPSSLPAGAEALVDLTGTGFSFTQGPVSVGFGTSDILVRRIFAISANHVIADVSVSPNAALSNPDVSIVNGFQIATATAGFQITAPVTGLPASIPVLTNAVPGLNGAYTGAIVSLYGSNLAAPGSTPTIAIAGQPANILYSSPTQINLQIPPGIPSGPTVLTLNNGVLNAYPVEINIDTAPAGINAVQTLSGVYIDSSHAAHPGDQLIVTLSNFSTASSVATSRVQVGVGGAMQTVSLVNSPVTGLYQVTFQLSPNQTVGSSEQLVVYLDGRSSLPASIPVANPDGTFTVSP